MKLHTMHHPSVAFFIILLLVPAFLACASEDSSDSKKSGSPLTGTWLSWCKDYDAPDGRLDTHVYTATTFSATEQLYTDDLTCTSGSEGASDSYSGTYTIGGEIDFAGTIVNKLDLVIVGMGTVKSVFRIDSDTTPNRLYYGDESSSLDGEGYPTALDVEYATKQ